MARSRLRENQILDADLLTEVEHLVLDHTGIPGCTTVSGYSGSVPIITSITVSGVAYRSYLVFENGILTTVSGNESVEFSDGDSLSIF